MEKEVVKITERKIDEEWWNMFQEDIIMVMEQFGAYPPHLRMLADIMEAEEKCKEK